MRYIWLCVILLVSLTIPTNAAELSAPQAPPDVNEFMPPNQESFAEGLWYVIRSAIEKVSPDIMEAAKICITTIGSVMLIGVLSGFTSESKTVVQLAGVLTLAMILLSGTKSLVNEGASTVNDLSEYGKLLLPVMTAALASQGGITSSTSTYIATALFDALLLKAIQVLLIPLLYIYLVLSISNSALEHEMLKKMRDISKKIIVWGLRTILYAFIGYITISGVISGTTDQMALRATKLTISGMVPVVGGIISDASEAVLVGAGVVKNAAGVYGLLAVIAIVIGPFLKIGIHYLLLKLTSVVCSVFADKNMSDLIQDFSSGMGLVLAMTGSMCLLFMISTICLMKGMG